MGFMFYIWLTVMVLAVIIEIATTDLTSFWFAIGALAALITSLFFPNDGTTGIIVEIVVFALISFLALSILRPLFKKKFDSPKIATNVDSLIGKIVIVESEIALNQPGSVKAEGIEWTAISTNDTFQPGDLVEIASIKGNTFTVTKAKNN